MKDHEIKKVVREGYAKIARQGSCGCSPVSSCCGGPDTAQDISKRVGYTDDEIGSVPEGANLGLGCGNPLALESLKKGETVLDLGSGGGFDCFLAAQKVGPTGKVIGVDMTHEMLARARANAEKSGLGNVEFRLGEIENLPVADNSVDVVISNCVINLSPDKGRVFQEAFRALKPGGRVMVSDIVLLKALPDAIKNSVAAYVGCVGGATIKGEYLDAIKGAGFQNVKVAEEAAFPVDLMADDPTVIAAIKDSGITKEEVKDIAASIVSVKVQAAKPK
jgi:arsenite methyltransferase